MPIHPRGSSVTRGLRQFTPEVPPSLGAFGNSLIRENSSNPPNPCSQLSANRNTDKSDYADYRGFISALNFNSVLICQLANLPTCQLANPPIHPRGSFLTRGLLQFANSPPNFHKRKTADNLSAVFRLCCRFRFFYLRFHPIRGDRSRTLNRMSECAIPK